MMMKLSRTDEPLHTPAKVLFLRSYSKAPFSAAIAGGLIRSPKIKIWQYPPWPSRAIEKLAKLPHAEEAWRDLQVGLIDNSQELLDKIHLGFFDLAVVSDEDGQLFVQQQSRRKSRVLYDHAYNAVVTGLARTGIRWPCFQTLRLSIEDIVAAMPVTVIDRSDAPFLTSASQNLLKSCSVYFKRELPFDRFFLFYHQRPSPWREKRKELLSVLEKVYGIPLGIEDAAYIELKGKRVEDQPIDVLFVGSITNTMRKTGLERLEKWAAVRPFRVEIHKSLPYEDYCRMTAQSKVTISIAGGGWDCFRHYEAAALGSIPLMNRPTIDAVWWHSMPKEMFFENTFDDFENRLDALLTEKHLRSTSLAILQKHLEDHLLHSKIVEYAVHATLEKCMEARHV